MAGIFSDVSTDIQKLRQLKAEIENVKKALKGINVNVDIDIAKGMEAQLKSLTTQYEALVRKVSEAEGKIMISTKRINDASEKIIKAQERLSRYTGVNPQSGNGNINVSTNNTETASVQAQAKAYDELAREIDGVMGTRTQNIKRMIEEQNAIRLINEEIKKLTKFQTGTSTLTETQQKRLEQLNNSLLTHKAALAEVRQTLMNNAKLDNVAATSMNGLSQSLSRMRIAYRELTEEERNSPFGKELLASIQQADAKIKELDTTIGNHQRNVGNYAKGYNGLNMSVQQIVRELPSASIGLNMFFLAISNNLPILTDEIKRAKAANEELKASGQKGVPVWKQVVSSLFSWQSALMVGITLLTVHGDKVWEWTKKVIVGESAAEKMKKAMIELNEVEKNAYATQIKTRMGLNTVISSIEKFNGTKEQEKQKIDELNSKYGSIFGIYNSLAQWYDILVNKGDAYINSLFAQAKAQSYIQKAIEADQKIRDIKASGIESYRPIWGAGGKVYHFLGGGKKNQLGSDPAELAYNIALTQAEQEKNNALRNAEDAQLSYLNGIKKNGIFDYRTITNQDTGKQKRKKEDSIIQQKSLISELEQKQSLDRAREAVDLENQIEQARIDAMANGGDKILAQRELNNKKEMQAIERAKEEYILKEIQRQKEIFEATEDLKAKQNPKYKKRSFDSSSVSVDTSAFDILKGNTDKRQIQEDLNAQREAMNAYLAEYGTYMQKRQAIIEQYQDKINKATTEGEKLTLGKQRDSILSGIDEQANNTTSAVSKLFGDMKDKTLKDLEAINEAGQKALEFLKSGKWDEATGKELGITKENFETWSNDPEKIKAISDALVDNRKAADDLQPAYKKVADGIGDAFDAGDDSKKLEEALVRIRDGMNEIMQVGSFLSETFSSLGDAFGNETLTGIADGINVAMDAMNSTMQGAQAGAMFGPIGAAAGAAIGLVGSLASSIAGIHDSKNEKDIQDLQEQIDALGRSYDNLGDSIEKAYSKDASNLIEQQNRLLEQQKVLIQQQIREEQDKKKSDDERIKEWQQQIEDINELIEDNKEAAIDAIFGEDLKSAIDNFAAAYAEAWANGENRAESAKEVVKNMMRQMVTESIKSATQASGAMEKIRQKLQEFYSDNVLSSWEQDYIYNMAEELQKELDKQFGWADDLMKDDKEQQSATSRGFGTEMTHEDAGELSGRFTAVYESNLRIEAAEQQQTVAITELRGSISALTTQAAGMYNIADETRTILANSYLELQQIRENTEDSAKYLKDIKTDIAEVKRNTSRL